MPGVGVALMGALVVVELAGLPAKYLSRARQVPLSWKHVFPPRLSAALYGGVLGLGVSSTIYFWSFHALMLGIFLKGGIVVGALAGMAFGLGRALPVIVLGLALDDERLDRLVLWSSELVARKRYFLSALSAFAITLLALPFLRAA